ncbi:glycosyltransferase family 2 protein [Mycobacterium sp. NS-7484]|uniref:glycosyltransferase family 2 protein n=1 Tax=Mycobacterium sp. NS-7484 TaxID=1834161 RepID=UPI00096DA2B4|nr:glycosyltransferase family 2 protein [Mycobacterium sp. NS-7484]
MGNKLPVVAAIPNYNMGDNLHRLLPQVLAQGYDGVYVLDDASTDHSADVVRQFGDDVTFVRSPRNQGAGANRNQIIDQVADRSLIHFVDADMELQTEGIPTTARELFARYAGDGVGLVGGLVCKQDGSQEPHNYGAVFSAWGGLSSGFPLMIDRLRSHPQLARAAQRLVGPIMKGWPNILTTPTPAPAYWLHEGNMLVDSDVLRSLGGYDPVLRCHETQDLAIRMEKRGIKRQFDPAIKVLHLHIDVRGKNRNKWANRAVLQLIHKHGFLRWLCDT